MAPESFTILCLSTIYLLSTVVYGSQNGGDKCGEKNSGFSFASYYGDHMVIQQTPVRSPVWGYAESKDLFQNVTIIVSSEDGNYIRKYTTMVVIGPFLGRTVWTIDLDPHLPGGPYKLSATINMATISLRDIYFGDVWLCAGESNMLFTVPDMFNATKELAESLKYDKIRLFAAGPSSANKPLFDFQKVILPWSRPSSDTLGNNTRPFDIFSAVCWLYAKKLYQQLKIPIGAVVVGKKSSPIEMWSSPDALTHCYSSADMLPLPAKASNSKELGNRINAKFSSVWNALIHPMLNMTLKGAIYYQGESNLDSANYNCTFRALIKDWRTKFFEASGKQTDPTFPFGFVQLSGRRPPSPGTSTSGFASIRWQQTSNFGYVPNHIMPRVFMAVAMDLPDFSSPYGSVNSRHRVEIGERLALAGLAIAYYKQVVYDGPYPATYRLDADKSLIYILYDEPITVQDTVGFEVCCPEENVTQCDLLSMKHWFAAPIMKHDNFSVVLSWPHCSSKGVLHAARYAWRESPCNYLNCAVYGQVNNLPSPPHAFYGSLQRKNLYSWHTIDRYNPVLV